MHSPTPLIWAAWLNGNGWVGASTASQDLAHLLWRHELKIQPCLCKRKRSGGFEKVAVSTLDITATCHMGDIHLAGVETALLWCSHTLSLRYYCITLQWNNLSQLMYAHKQPHASTYTYLISFCEAINLSSSITVYFWNKSKASLIKKLFFFFFWLAWKYAVPSHRKLWRFHPSPNKKSIKSSDSKE